MIDGLERSLKRFVIGVISGGNIERNPWDYAIDISEIIERNKSLPTVENLINNGIPKKYAIVYLAYAHYLLNKTPRDKNVRRVFNLFREIGERDGKYVTQKEFYSLLKKYNIEDLRDIIETILVEDDYGGLALGTGGLCEAIYRTCRNISYSLQ